MNKQSEYQIVSLILWIFNFRYNVPQYDFII